MEEILHTKRELVIINKEPFAIRVDFFDKGMVRVSSIDHPEIFFKGMSKKQAMMDVKRKIIQKLF